MNLRLLLIPAGLLLLGAAWLWSNRPQKIDIAKLAPAESIIYVEANDLPRILSGLASTSAWRELAPAAGLRSDFGSAGWLGRLSDWTGVGTAESVVLARAQVAIVVLGFETESGAEGGATVRPRLALVAETHTGEARTKAAITKFVGDFARRAYGEAKLEQTERDGASLLTWAPARGARRIHAAISDGYAVVGTDEAAVRACLAVRRGEAASLADDPRLVEVRERVGGADALVFGYVPQQAAPKLSEIAALFLTNQLALDASEQSGAAIILPQLAARLIGAAGWGAHVGGGSVEDRYFLALAEGIAPRLSSALQAPREQAFNATGFVPADAHQLTRYNFTEPAEAWRGLNAAVSSQVDFTLAPAIVRLLDQQLLPYGVDAPRDFLRAVGPEIATARLDREGERMALVALVRDEAALRALVRKRFGDRANAVKIGDAEMFAAADEELGAAAFAAGHFITGDAESVRRCLQARAAGQTLDGTEAFRRLAPSLSTTAHFLTLSDDREQARGFAALVARQRWAVRKPADTAAMEGSLSKLPFAASETRLTADGFERTTRSSFGQIGSLALRFSSDADSRR